MELIYLGGKLVKFVPFLDIVNLIASIDASDAVDAVFGAPVQPNTNVGDLIRLHIAPHI